MVECSFIPTFEIANNYEIESLLFLAALHVLFALLSVVSPAAHLHSDRMRLRFAEIVWRCFLTQEAL